MDFPKSIIEVSINTADVFPEIDHRLTTDASQIHHRQSSVGAWATIYLGSRNWGCLKVELRTSVFEATQEEDKAIEKDKGCWVDAIITQSNFMLPLQAGF
ncbi:hypothetical protein L1987_12865 [Smallanthus sonchifolius]|uniref:Uncharacterized protein n=1 Tax=Smallanthus sonchifolius TaxID=185202 RepID=A0ACB9JGH6_9ASTR|nr:hypothetical protein L1987_12865 [Smallanthus sonchifolius]